MHVLSGSGYENQIDWVWKKWLNDVDLHGAAVSVLVSVPYFIQLHAEPRSLREQSGNNPRSNLTLHRAAKLQL